MIYSECLLFCGLFFLLVHHALAFDCLIDVDSPKENKSYHPQNSLQAVIKVSFGQGPISDSVRNSPQSYNVCIQWDPAFAITCIPLIGYGESPNVYFPRDGSIGDGWHNFSASISHRDTSISIHEVHVQYMISTTSPDAESHQLIFNKHDCSLPFQKVSNHYFRAILKPNVPARAPIVALLLVGQIRSLSQTSAMLAARLSKPNDADVFSVIADEPGNNIDDIRNLLVDSFGSQKVKEVRFMSQLNCSFDSWKRRDYSLCFHHLNATGRGYSFLLDFAFNNLSHKFAELSFQFKQYEAGLNLILAHEDATGRLYDALIKCRYDVVPNAPITIQQRLFVDAHTFGVIRKTAVSLATRVLPLETGSAVIHALGSMAALMFGKAELVGSIF